MRTSAKVYWLAFAVWQICGFMALLFSDVHMNVVPRRIGWVLLLPGTLVAWKLSDALPDKILPVVIVLVNLVAWFVLLKISLSAKSRVPAGK